MFNLIKRIIAGYEKKPVVFSIPNEKFEFCAVKIYESYFSTTNKIVFDPSKGHVKFYNNNTFEIDNSKLILIGHPEFSNYSGIISSDEKVLKSNYFRKSTNEPYEVCFSLICFGYKMFMSPHGWRDIAHLNLCFLGEIATEYDIQLPKVHLVFKKIYNTIYGLINEHKSSDDLFALIRNVYVKGIIDAHKNLSDKDGRAVAILYLSDKADFLTKI